MQRKNMFNSLFNIRFNWPAYFVVLLLIYAVFPGLSFLSVLAIAVTLHQFCLLFLSFNHCIPIRYLFGFLMSLQLLLGPVFAFNGLDYHTISIYKMHISEADYFVYVLPAVISFIMGLHFFAGNLKGEIIDVSPIKKFVAANKKMPYFFIAVGFLCGFVSGYFSSDLAFLIYLLSGFKFIGVFLLITGEERLKILPLMLVFGFVITTALAQGMFHDLLIWTVLLTAFLAMKFKPSQKVKLVLAFTFLVVVFVIQITKVEYRSATWSSGEEGGIETFAKAYENNRRSNDIFDLRNLANNNTRINQGFIITNIMRTVPDRIPFQNGQELKVILESAFLPRVLAPDKLNAGDREHFMKYTGMQIARNTSMALSSVGDAYVNFGRIGGCVFMFFLGLFYNYVLILFWRKSAVYPLLLLFIPLVFYYPIRPDCELQTILGHLVKSCFLIYVIMQVWKRYFKVQNRFFANRFSFN